MNNFKELNLSTTMLETIAKAGYQKPSEIQAKAIPIALTGKDIIGQAQTGTGKTASFAIPIIEKTQPGMGIQHVVLAPSRELTKQIYEEIKKLSINFNIKVANIIGGVSYDVQHREIKKEPEILIATPGRLIDHLESKRVNINLNAVKTLILDEADEMLNFGFYKEMLKIRDFLPKSLQILLFTATFNKRTKLLAQNLLKDPVNIQVSSGLNTNKKVKQEYLVLKEKQKFVALYNLLLSSDYNSVIIFGRTRKRVDELTQALGKVGIKCAGIQGDMRQKERTYAITQFRTGKIKVLIGTDVLARGIDVDTVDMVINFDLPTEIEYYTHRIGRTGRAGRTGRSVSFAKHQELFFIDKIISQTNSEIKEIEQLKDQDMADIRAEKLDVQLSKLLHVGREKYRNIGNKIVAEYDSEHIAMMLAAAVIADTVSPYDISLSGERGVDDPKAKRRKSSGFNFRSNHRRQEGRKKTSFHRKDKSTKSTKSAKSKKWTKK